MCVYVCVRVKDESEYRASCNGRMASRWRRFDFYGISLKGGLC